jgi:hypothetical protein
MIILDTCVVSEPMKPRPDPNVVAWLDRQTAESLYLTATSLSELLVGIVVLPAGRKRQGLSAALSELMLRLFGARILPFDRLAAEEFARLVTRAKTARFTLPVSDGQIAAISSVHGFTVATRDVDRFIAAGIPIVNPWNP